VALLDAGFGLAFTIARRAPLARLRAVASDKPRVVRIKKVFSFGKVLHFTPLTRAAWLGAMKTIFSWKNLNLLGFLLYF
jgi:hypothetical protein